MPKITTVAPGVRVCSVRTDRFKTSSISVAMALPMGGNMSAKALLPYVLKRSSREYPDFARLNGKLDELYGALLSAGVSKCGEALILSMATTCIDDRFALDNGESIIAESAALLAGMLFEPDFKNGIFNEEILTDEKRLMKQRIEEEVNDKMIFSRNRCIEIMCADEPFGLDKFGTLEELEAVTAESLTETWREVLSKATVMITVVSSAPAEAVEKLFAERFAGVDRAPAEIKTVFIPKAGELKKVTESFKVNQGKLVLGFRAGMENKDDNYVAEVMMNDIFGGNVYSKLFTVVREKLSLCYYCWAHLFSQKGIILVSCGIDSDKEKEATEAILARLDEMRSGDFTEEDMKASVMGMRERWLGSVDSPGSICSWYNTMVLDEKVVEPEEMVAMLENVTKEDIMAAAARVTFDTAYMLRAEEDENEDN